MKRAIALPLQRKVALNPDRKRKLALNPDRKRKLQWLAARFRPKRRKEAKVYMTDKETHMLAVVNMDWDHIKAVDLYMVMTSGIPEGGRVLSVSIYPTEFGLKCMRVEAAIGPSALIGADCEEDSDFEAENNKLRTSLNRRRFYYAVVLCDSRATALHLYTTFDGTEFLKTANVFDLRFIPGSMDFNYPALDVATEAPPSYKEPDFGTQLTKVEPIWDNDAKLDKLLKYISRYEGESDQWFCTTGVSRNKHRRCAPVGEPNDGETWSQDSAANSLVRRSKSKLE
ncbi:pre-rRNA-processing protein esf1-like isoform X2 [Lolium rigidum]|uniref:pre-rRNA-processing protein esf1-like isoform X2 n=1 Tax=Lolium rigidum TaxID=89674 RepID=UPI001F5C12DA|nr:pre-rRNA-processing protein esf1-like isoform X2 [Lolium rigidum]